MGSVTRQVHLHKRGEVYYCRIALPKSLEHIIGRSEYKKSLKTSDVRLAKIMCRDLSNRMEAFFMMVKAMRPKDSDIQALIKHYFETCLAEGEQMLTFETVTARSPEIDEYQATDIQLTASITEQNLAVLNDLRQRHIYGRTQEEAALRLLDKHGYKLPTDSERYHQFCLDLVRAGTEAERIKLAYFRGDAITGQILDPMFKGYTNYFEKPDPEYFARQRQAINNDEQRPTTLEEAIPLFLEDKRLKRKSSDVQINRIDMCLGRLKDILGASKPLSEITGRDGVRIETTMYRIPVNYTQKYEMKCISFRDALASDGPKMNTRTIGSYMIHQKAFFKWAHKQGYIDIDPMAAIELPEKRRTARGEVRRPFTKAELGDLFASAVFTGRKNEKRTLWEKGDIKLKDGNFWVPLVALFTGMRMGEILYLLPKDIKQDDEVWYIDVNKDDEGKSLKNVQSQRKIPIHPELIKIGLLDYVRNRTSLHQRTGERLFEDGITLPDNQTVIKNYSRSFSTYLQNIKLKKDKKLVFHSFRHNFVDQLRVVPGITEEIMNALDGREAGNEKMSSTRNVYGSDLTPSFLYDWINKISYAIDLTHLYPEKA
jgi:integrase